MDLIIFTAQKWDRYVGKDYATENTLPVAFMHTSLSWEKKQINAFNVANIVEGNRKN